MIYFAADFVGFPTKRQCHSKSSGLQRLPQMERDEKKQKKSESSGWGPKVSRETRAFFKRGVNRTDRTSEGDFFPLDVGQEILVRRDKSAAASKRRGEKSSHSQRLWSLPGSPVSRLCKSGCCNREQRLWISGPPPLTSPGSSGAP